MSNPEVVDPVVAESLRQLTPPGEPDVLTEVLQLFLEDAPRRIERLRVAWSTGHADDLHRAAHSLKGSAGNIGARRLYAVCQQIDERAKAGNVQADEALLASLDGAYAELEQEIRRLLQTS